MPTPWWRGREGDRLGVHRGARPSADEVELLDQGVGVGAPAGLPQPQHGRAAPPCAVGSVWSPRIAAAAPRWRRPCRPGRRGGAPQGPRGGGLVGPGRPGADRRAGARQAAGASDAGPACAASRRVEGGGPRGAGLSAAGPPVLARRCQPPAPADTPTPRRAGRSSGRARALRGSGGSGRRGAGTAPRRRRGRRRSPRRGRHGVGASARCPGPPAAAARGSTT